MKDRANSDDVREKTKTAHIGVTPRMRRLAKAGT